jgi:hypothetical protein
MGHVMNSPLPIGQRNTADGLIKIDLDERAFVYPQNKALLQLQLQLVRPDTVRFEAVYAFNQNRESPVLFEMSGDDCAEFSRRLVEAVYRAQSTQVVSPSVSLSITVVANGYILQYNDPQGPIELFLGSPSIWRVCSGLARAVDFLAPIASN